MATKEAVPPRRTSTLPDDDTKLLLTVTNYYHSCLRNTPDSLAYPAARAVKGQ